MPRNNTDFHELSFNYAVQPYHHYLEASILGEPVGGMLWKKNSGAVDQITVSEPHRRKGVGTMLYKQAVSYAKDNNLVAPDFSKSRFLTPEGRAFTEKLDRDA
jgi:GNAT superfamily N-acetyltransferase